MLIGFTWSQALSSFFEQDRILKKLKEIEVSVKILNKSISIRRYRNAEACSSYLWSKFIEAEEIINTCVITLKNNNDSRNYLIRINDKIIENILSYLRRERVWHDLVSTVAIQSRVSVIKSKMPPGSKYYAREMVSNMPIINFIILDYGHGKEVFFGFGLHEASVEDNVYSSTDQNIVETFDRYYKALFEFHSRAIP